MPEALAAAPLAAAELVLGASAGVAVGAASLCVSACCAYAAKVANVDATARASVKRFVFNVDFFIVVISYYFFNG